MLLVTGARAGCRRGGGGRRRSPRSGPTPPCERALLVIDAAQTTLAEQRKRQLADNPEGHRWAVDNAWLSGSADEVRAGDAPAYTTLPNEKAFTIWFSMAPLRELPDMAFSMQSEIYLATYVLWHDAADDERSPGVARPGDGRPRAGHRRPVPRRQRPHPPPGRSSCPTRTGHGCRRSAPDATLTGSSSATSPDPTGCAQREPLGVIGRIVWCAAPRRPRPSESNSQWCAGSESRSRANQ